jgi:hypothetical protein
MFILIDTKNASHIAISVPRQGADRSLPAILGMLEGNAVFIDMGGYGRPTEKVKPKITIELGNELSFDNRSEHLYILNPDSQCVLGDSFDPHTPELVVSYMKAIDEKDKAINALRVELAHVKQQLEKCNTAYNEACRFVQES